MNLQSNSAKQRESMDLNPTRSPGDEKEYRLITLQCGLECLLISTRKRCERLGDLEYARAAAAMSVQVGSFADPEMAEGCAHFLEHMVFMGSKKYPVENHYDSFVTAHGGSCNAFTEAESTVYQFDINNAYFSEGLDVFAQCFISPLLAPGAVDREIKAIDSEFDLAKNSDESRLQQLMSHLCHRGHPMNKFSWGSLNSLSKIPKQHGLDIWKVVYNFHKKHYVPENMKLVVIAPKPLEELEVDVHNSFDSWTATIASEEGEDFSAKRQKTDIATDDTDANEVASKIVKPLQECLKEWHGTSPFDENMLKTMKRVIPVRSVHKLILTWAMPPMAAQYRSKPVSYIAHLMGHEGPGSLLSALKAKNYAASVSAGVSGSNFDDNSLSTFFEVSVSLTENGLANWIDVAWQVHHYIDMLQRIGPQEWVHNELKDLGEVFYRFLDEEEESEYVEGISMEMLPLLKRDRQDLLPAAYLTWDFDPQQIALLLNDYLTVRKASVTLISSAFNLDDKESAGSSTAMQIDDIEVDIEEDDNDNNSDSGSSGDGSDETASDESEEDEEKNDDNEHDETPAHDSLPAISAEDIERLYKGPKEWLDFSLPPLTAEEATERSGRDKNMRLLHKDILTEPHFGTSYWLTELPQNLINFWETAGTNLDKAHYGTEGEKMHLPPKNWFIPTDLRMVSEKRRIAVDEMKITDNAMMESSETGPETDELENISTDQPHLIIPKKLETEKGITLWYALDESFKCPKAEIYARVVSQVPTADAWSAAMLDLSCRVIKDRLNEMLYMASMADLHCEITTSDIGFTVKVSGYSDKACLLMETVLATLLNESGGNVQENGDSLLHQPLLTDSSVLKDAIDRELDELIKRYNNLNLKSSQAASNGRVCALKPSKYMFSDRAAALQNATVPIDASLIREYMNQIRNNLSVEMLVYGNIEENAAISTASVIRRCMTTSPSIHPPQPVVQIPLNQGMVLHQIPSNPKEKNICVELYFQLRAWNVLDATKLDMLEQIISEPYFDQLRTKQQLGYSVSCGVRQTFGTLGFCFKVVSSSFSIAHVLSSIVNFLSMIPKELLLDCGWQHYLDNANALIDNKLRHFRTMNEAATHHWGVIEDCFYDHFDDNEKQAVLLKEMIVYVNETKESKDTAVSRDASSSLRNSIQRDEVEERGSSAAKELSPVAMSEFARKLLLEEPKILCVLSSVDGDEEHAPDALVAAAVDALSVAFPDSTIQAAGRVEDVHSFDHRTMNH